MPSLLVQTPHLIVSMARLLVGHGALIDAKDRYRDTALHHAARRRDYSLFRVLAAWGANPKILNREGMAAEALFNA